MYQDPRVSREVEDLRRRVWLIEQRLGMVGAPAAAGSVRPPTPQPIELSLPTSAVPTEVISKLVEAGPEPSKPVPLAKSRAFSRLIQEQSHPEASPAQAPADAAPPSFPATPGAPTMRPSFAAAARSTLERANITPQPPAMAEPRYRPPPMPIKAAGKERADFSLERLIGGRWYAWIGALAVVVGIGLLFKYAYDQHWLRVPPNWRCILGATFGLALIGVGEFIKRKINAVASAGIFAAGIGTVYASVFAAYRLYTLLPNHTALVLLALTAALGIVMGARARLVSVTTVSLLGGYLAPFLMDVPKGDPAVLPLFLLTLMSVGLTLAAWLRGPFIILRPLTWWATVLIGGVWVLNTGVHNLTLALVFLGLTWAGVHAELLVLARRRLLVSEEHRAPERQWLTWRPLVSSFSSTAWTVLLAVRVLDAFGIADWIAPGALFGATSMLWMALAGNLSALREAPRTDAERLGACLGAQAGALLIATISMALGNWGEVIAWLTLGVSSIVAGRWLRTRAFDVYGLVVLALCTARLLLVDSWMSRMTAGGEHMFGLVFSQWTALTAATAAAWIASGVLIRPAAVVQSRWRNIGNFMVGVGIVLLGGALVNSGNDPWTLPAIAASVGILMAGAGRTIKSQGLAIAAMVSQLLATILLFPTEWWNATSPNAFTALGFYIVPQALVAPFVGLMWLLTPAVARPVFQAQREASDLGLAAFITLCFAPLLHTSVHLNSLAAAILTAGLLLMTVGWRRDSKGLSIYGVAVLAAGTIAAIANKWWQAAGWGQFLGLSFGPEVLILMYAAVAWILTALAALRLKIDEREHLARLCTAIGMALLMAGAYHDHMLMGALCVSWLVIATLTGALRKVRPELCLDWFMLAGLVPATFVWVTEYAVDWHDVAAPFGLHPGLGIAALLAGGYIVGSSWSSRMPGRTPETAKLLHVLSALVALALVFTSTSLEVARVAAGLADEPRVRAAAVSIWWGIFAVLLITAGFWKRITPARHVGLGLLAVAMGKALVLDLQGVPQIWRIASFIGLGLLMLGVAVGYSKVSAIWNDKLGAEEPKPGALPS